QPNRLLSRVFAPDAPFFRDAGPDRRTPAAVPFHAARSPRSMADDDPLHALGGTVAAHLRHHVCFHPNASPDEFDRRSLKRTLPRRHHMLVTEDQDPATNRARHFISESTSHFIGHGVEVERISPAAAASPALLPEIPMNMLRVR